MPAGPQDRQLWTTLADRIARPVLARCAAGTLKQQMPVEAPGSLAQ